MNEDLNPLAIMRLRDLGLGEISLSDFVYRFKLQNYSYYELLKFVLDENNHQDIIGYYSQLEYSKIEDRSRTYDDEYDYEQGEYEKK